MREPCATVTDSTPDREDAARRALGGASRVDVAGRTVRSGGRVESLLAALGHTRVTIRHGKVGTDGRRCDDVLRSREPTAPPRSTTAPIPSVAALEGAASRRSGPQRPAVLEGATKGRGGP